MACCLCAAADAWPFDWWKADICTPCYERENMSVKCASCSGWMIRRRNRDGTLGDHECTKCYRVPFTKRYQKKPFDPAAKVAAVTNAATATFTWVFVAAFLLALGIGALGFFGGLYGLDWQFSRNLTELHAELGDIWFWWPKAAVFTLIVLPPLLFTRWWRS